ncbi:Alpha-NAC protein [Entamoeba marina]
MSDSTEQVQTTPVEETIETQKTCECDEECKCGDDCKCGDECECEECHHEHEHVEQPASTHVMSKGEKKARKALEKVGLIELTDVIEFSLKRQGMKFVIHDPAVFKLPSSEHYVIYGEPKNEMMDAKTRELLEQLQANMKTENNAGEAQENVEDVKEENVENQEEEVDNDYEPNEEDITVLMGQASTTREKAVAALKKTKGDLVTAFFEFQ